MNLADRLLDYAREAPGKCAVIEGDRSTDFRTLDLAAWRAAAWLRAEGIRPGDVVGLAMGDSTLHLAMGFALARVGAVQLCLPRRAVRQENVRLAGRHRAVALVADRPGSPGSRLRRLRPDPAWLDPGGDAPDASVRVPGGDRPWIILRTSGTTGLPKAVLQSHATYAARRELGRGPLSIGREDRYLAILSMNYSLGYKLCMDALWVGATVIIGAQYGRASEIISAVNRLGVTYLYLTPSHLHWMLPRLRPGPPCLPQLRVLRSGSMNLPERVRRIVVSQLTPNLVVSYGINDIDCGVTQADAATQERFPGSVGAARPGVELQIVDDDGRVLEPGTVGQVRIRIPQMPEGYIDDPQATAQAFRGGWFHPGDLALVTREGMLHLKGRVDDLMNCDGIKILPAEIEEVLLAHPAVAEAAAFPVASERRQHAPVAAVVLRSPVKEEALLKWCAERMGLRAPFAVAVLRALPRNEMGKVLKKDLAEKLKHKLK